MCYEKEMDVETCRKFYQEKFVSEKFDSMIEGMDFNQDGKIQYGEFCDYYTNISPSFNVDSAFKGFIYSSWGMN